MRLKVDVITTAGDLSTRAAQQATTTSRSWPCWDSVESGFAKSLSRPGGNVTGFAVIGVELSAKRLELLKELVPRLRRVAVLWDPVTHERQLKAVEAARAASVLKPKSCMPNRSANLKPRSRPPRRRAPRQCWPMYVVGKRGELVRLAARVPDAGDVSQPRIHRGGRPDRLWTVDEQWQKIAGTIDRILKGARAAELPFQQPTRFELDVNLKAAREIGLEVPQSIRMRTSRFINDVGLATGVRSNHMKV